MTMSVQPTQLYTAPTSCQPGDRTPRLGAAVSMYRLQNAAVALSAFSAFLASFLTQGSLTFWICILATIFIGSVSSVGCQGSSLSVEREWTKALCHGNSDSLASLNAGMRRIDLTCLIASPVMASLIMTLASIRVAVVAILVWNMLAWWPECRLLQLAQHFSPLLRQQELAPASQEAPRLSLKSFRNSVAQSREAWQIYRSQAVFPAALALAMLYLTVMSFGLLMTAYLKWRGMLEATLGLYRAAGALAGIGATLCFSALHARLGLEGAGPVGLVCQWASLVVTLVLSSVLMHPAGSHVLAAGLVASRFGLWAFDLAVSQMLQERVPLEQLGVVNGMQSSLQSLLQSLSYAVGLLIWQPQLFIILMGGSVLTVSGALVLYLSIIDPENKPA
ncbi:g481 [Coccomyxa elongata]